MREKRNVLSCVRESYINLMSLCAAVCCWLFFTCHFPPEPTYTVCVCITNKQLTGGKRNEERLFKYFTFTVCTGMLLSSSTTTSSSQAATLWQIIYYFGENIQTVNPRFSRIFLIFALRSFIPRGWIILLSLWLRAYTVSIAEPLWIRKRRRKLGKWSKSLRWKLFALKMSLWVMHFLYASSASSGESYCLDFATFVFMWFLFSSSSSTRLSSVCRYSFSFSFHFYK